MTLPAAWRHARARTQVEAACRLDVQPSGILLYAVPLSALETFVAALIVSRRSAERRGGA